MCAALLSSFVFLSGYCETSQGNHILLVGLSVCVQQLAACPLPEETDKEKGGVTEERRGEKRGRGVVNMDDKLHNSW